jgi:signal transduction histidine kinase
MRGTKGQERSGRLPVNGIELTARPIFLRSTAIRLALAFGILFAGSALLIVAFIYYSTVATIDREIDRTVTAVSLDLDEIYRTAGVVAFEAAIERRIREDVEDEMIYVFLDVDGSVRAGNLPTPPSIDAPPDAFFDGSVDRGGKRALIRFRHTLFPDGRRLLVGLDDSDRLVFRRMVVDALSSSLLATAALSFMVAFALRRALMTRLEALASTASAIMAGNLGHRVPVTGSRDEFDQVAATLNAMLERIEVLMEGVRQVSNTVAHDLRTPLSRIRTRLEELQRSGIEERVSLEIEQAIGDIDGLLATFKALLRIAEIETGARRSAFAELDLAETLDGVVDLYADLADESGAVVHRHIDPGLRLLGDRHLIAQAVGNLLDNAVKYGGEGGKIEIVARAAADDRIEVVVADQGPGIPPAERGRVVERFYRVDASRGTPGTGMGLALVAAVAKLHGGELTLEDNAPGLRAVMRLHRLSTVDQA